MTTSTNACGWKSCTCIICCETSIIRSLVIQTFHLGPSLLYAYVDMQPHLFKLFIIRTSILDYTCKCSTLCGWIKHAARSMFTTQCTFSGHMTNIAHLGESHDQYRTLLESHDEYRTPFEHVKSHNEHSYRTLLHIYWDDNFGGFRQCHLAWLETRSFDGF